MPTRRWRCDAIGNVVDLFGVQQRRKDFLVAEKFAHDLNRHAIVDEFSSTREPLFRVGKNHIDGQLTYCSAESL